MNNATDSRNSNLPENARTRVEGGEFPSGSYPAYAVLMPPPPEAGSALVGDLTTEVRRLRPPPRDLASSIRALSAPPAPASARTNPPAALATVTRADARRRERLATARVLVASVVCGALLGVLIERLVSAFQGC